MWTYQLPDYLCGMCLHSHVCTVSLLLLFLHHWISWTCVCRMVQGKLDHQSCQEKPEGQSVTLASHPLFPWESADCLVQPIFFGWIDSGSLWIEIYWNHEQTQTVAPVYHATSSNWPIELLTTSMSKATEFEVCKATRATSALQTRLLFHRSEMGLQFQT